MRKEERQPRENKKLEKQRLKEVKSVMSREETRERRRGEISVIRERRGKGEMAVTRRDDVAEIRKRKRRIAVIRGKETRGRRNKK